MCLEKQSILVYDIETDGLDTSKAKCKYFGAYSYEDSKYYLMPHTEMQQIKALIQRHKTLIGFNNKEFDNQILQKHYISFKFKNVIDLLEVSKKRLVSMGIKTKDHKLKTIIDTLKLCEQSKGEINYDIFKKDIWTVEEIKYIESYVKQDILITKALFEWYFEQFKPLRELLSEDDKANFVDVKSSLASLSYRVVCNLADLPCEFQDKGENVERETFAGGHHIEPRQPKVKGNLVCIDIVSAYPHAIMQGNLYSNNPDGWNGKPFFNLQGSYNNKTFGKIESALKQIFLERLKAKKEKDKVKNLAYKIVINAFYGLTGNSAFKSLYNPTTASDCTSIVRTILKKLAKTIEENGFYCAYGFTDSIYVLIPEQSNKDELMFVVDTFVQEVKKNMPFPQETFKLEIEKEYKFIWFVTKNCYLWVDKNDCVGYRSTLLNQNTPEIIMQVFNDYMSNKIKEELDINFTQEELEQQIKIKLQNNLSLAAEEHNVDDLEKYKVKTSLQYQISEVYGQGKHFLIPNIKGIGVGKQKSTKKKIGVRYCTLEEFNNHGLTIQDIDISKLVKHLKEFYK